MKILYDLFINYVFYMYIYLINKYNKKYHKDYQK